MTPENTNESARNLWGEIRHNRFNDQSLIRLLGPSLLDGSLTIHEVSALIQNNYSQLPNQARYVEAARTLSQSPNSIDVTYPTAVDAFRLWIENRSESSDVTVGMDSKFNEPPIIEINPSPEDRARMRDEKLLLKFFQHDILTLRNRQYMHDEHTGIYSIGGGRNGFVPVLSLGFGEYRYVPEADSGVFFCHVYPDLMSELAKDSEIATLDDALRATAEYIGPTQRVGRRTVIDFSNELKAVFQGEYEFKTLDHYYMVGPRQFTQLGMQTSGALLIYSPDNSDILTLHAFFLPTPMMHESVIKEYFHTC